MKFAIMAGNNSRDHVHPGTLESDVSRPSSLGDSVMTADTSSEDFAVSDQTPFSSTNLHRQPLLLLVLAELPQCAYLGAVSSSLY